ncbi:MAG: hypothetical protein IPN67_06745, partial [Bacteroidales bacterium]|nr:hypothetical protein [Bacteroidales bacterium]
KIRPSIGGLAELSSLERIWGIYRPDQQQIVTDAYEQSLLYSEHTWGLANQHYLKVPYGKEWKSLWERGLPPQYRLMEKSWSDHAGYIRNVEKLITDPYQDAVSSLADNLNIEENRIVVYNPLPWSRDGEIELDTRLIFGNDFVSLKPVDGGPLVAVSHEYPALEDKAPMSRFVVSDIPSMGYRTFIASAGKAEIPEMSADAGSGIIESPFFKATIDPSRGRIVSMIDKRSGQELVDNSSGQGFGQYFYERFGYKEIADWIKKSLYDEYNVHKLMFAAYDMPQDVTYSFALPENMALTVEKSAIDVRAIMTGTLITKGQSQEISISLTLSGITPVADIEVSWQKLPDTWPEAAWICLPFKCNNPKYRLGRIGAIVDPEKDMITDNSNHHMWWVNTGVAIYNEETGRGIGICSPDAPVVSIGEPGEYKFDRQYRPEKPYVYVNLYNNHWRTNFPPWIGNGHRMNAHVRIWTFDKFNTESSLYTPGMETRVPLQVACSRVKNGKLKPAQQGISLSRKGVAVTAFGPNTDGEGLIFRVWEQSGRSGELEVKLPSGSEFILAQPVNLRGEKAGNPIKITEDKFSFDLHAYAPGSYILTSKQK